MNEPSNENSAVRQHGLTVLAAAIFVAAEMAGSGILALPKAIYDSGNVCFYRFCSSSSKFYQLFLP